jgi:hypothetical protein
MERLCFWALEVGADVDPYRIVKDLCFLGLCASE